VFIFDFGQNAAGRARLKVSGAAGTQIQIRHAEVLNPDGTLHTEILRGAKCTDTYILKGGKEEVWEPAFTYRGFRYAEVTGYPGTPTKDALTFRVMHANTPQIGEFVCSEDIINRVQKNIVWGARSNFYSVPTDCPQRDERLGWTGDMQLFLPAAAMNFDIAGYMTKWMGDIVDSRNADGSIPDVIPALSAAPGAPGWSDVVVTLPWSMLRYYGDMRIVEESKEAMEGHLDFMRSMAKDGLFSRGRYGDWVALEDTPRDSLAGAYQFLSTRRLAEIAKTVSNGTATTAIEQEAEQLADLYNARYFDTSANHYQTGSQTAQVIPLAFGIAQAEQPPRHGLHRLGLSHARAERQRPRRSGGHPRKQPHLSLLGLHGGIRRDHHLGAMEQRYGGSHQIGDELLQPFHFRQCERVVLRVSAGNSPPGAGFQGDRDQTPCGGGNLGEGKLPLHVWPHPLRVDQEGERIHDDGRDSAEHERGDCATGSVRS
jgi:hypothetical protein